MSVIYSVGIDGIVNSGIRKSKTFLKEKWVGRQLSKKDVGND